MNQMKNDKMKMDKMNKPADPMNKNTNAMPKDSPMKDNDM